MTDQHTVNKVYKTRIEPRIQKHQNGCWVLECSANPKRYPNIKIGDGLYKTHRIVFHHFNGLIADGIELSHSCNNRHCMNPGHMVPLNRSENVNRRTYKTVVDQIKSNILIDQNGCWVWQKNLNKDGYAHMFHQKKTLRVHRVSYKIFKGPIPSGLDIDHLCRNQRCVNPDHLEAVTTKENIRRSSAPGGRLYKTKTHCKNVHPRTMDESGQRGFCHPCRKAKYKRYDLKRNAKVGGG